MLFYRLYRLSLFIKKCFKLFDKYKKKIIKRRKNTFDIKVMHKQAPKCCPISIYTPLEVRQKTSPAVHTGDVIQVFEGFVLGP